MGLQSSDSPVHPSIDRVVAVFKVAMITKKPVLIRDAKPFVALPGDGIQRVRKDFDFLHTRLLCHQINCRQTIDALSGVGGFPIHHISVIGIR